MVQQLFGVFFCKVKWSADSVRHIGAAVEGKKNVLKWFAWRAFSIHCRKHLHICFSITTKRVEWCYFHALGVFLRFLREAPFSYFPALGAVTVEV